MYWTRFKLWFDRTISNNGPRQWAIPALSFCISIVIFALTLLLVNNGWCLMENSAFKATDSYAPKNVLDAAFYHMFTNGGQNLYHSHFWGAIITIVGLIVIAILTSSITNFFEQRAKQYLSGETNYYFKDHIVILGSSDVLYSIIDQLKKGTYFIVIQTCQDVEKKRREVFSFIKDNEFDKQRLVFLYGDRTSLHDVMKLHLETAQEVYIIGDTSENENGESYRDAYNIDCIKTIKDSIAIPNATQKCSNERKHLRCNIMFEYQTTFSAFQDSDIDSATIEYIDFEPFSFHETWAQKVLVECDQYKPLDQIDQSSFIDRDSEKSVHLVIIGMSKMGVALAIEAAQVCHFPNYVSKNKKTRITFIDADADVEQEFFSGRFRELKKLSTWDYKDANSTDFKYQAVLPHTLTEDWLDIEWEFIRGRVEQESVRSFLTEAAADETHILTLAICLPQSHQAIAAALYLPETVLSRCLQTLVYQRISGSLVKQIASNANGKLYKLKPFGMVENVFSSTLHNDDKAMMVAYSYDTLYQEFERLKKEAEKSNDINIKDLTKSIAWENVDYQLTGFNKTTYSKGDWRMKVVNRWSSRAYANSINAKLRSVKVDDTMDRENISKIMEDNLQLLIQMEHNRWNIEKLIAGYRPYTREEISELPDYASKEWEAKVKSLKKKKAHIDLCSYDELKARDCNNVCYDQVLIKAIPYIITK